MPTGRVFLAIILLTLRAIAAALEVPMVELLLDVLGTERAPHDRLKFVNANLVDDAGQWDVPNSYCWARIGSPS